MPKLSKQEFYAKYGNVVVCFSSYYKYTFTYEAVLPDGKRLTCGYGGNADEIYRHEAASGGEELLSSLQPYEGAVYQEGAEVESFYDY